MPRRSRAASGFWAGALLAAAALALALAGRRAWAAALRGRGGGGGGGGGWAAQGPGAGGARCPARWAHVLHLQAPEAAGSVVRAALAAGPGGNATAPPPLRWCGPPPGEAPRAGDPPLNCLLLGRAELAAAQGGLRARFGASPGAKPCGAHSTQWDVPSTLEAVPPTALEATLTVAVIRNPVDRLAAAARALRAHVGALDAGARAAHAAAGADLAAAYDVGGWLDGYAGLLPDHQTRWLAGQLGCGNQYGGDGGEGGGGGGAAAAAAPRRPPTTGAGMLAAALAALDRVCVVLVHERLLGEGLELLRWRLGWPRGGGGAAAADAAARAAWAATGAAARVPATDPNYMRLRAAGELDATLYEAALARFEADVRAMRREQAAEEEAEEEEAIRGAPRPPAAGPADFE